MQAAFEALKENHKQALQSAEESNTQLKEVTLFVSYSLLIDY